LLPLPSRALAEADLADLGSSSNSSSRRPKRPAAVACGACASSVHLYLGQDRILFF
jgi:hypothetical protein